MEKITAFFDGMDLTKLVPEMNSLLDTLHLICKIVILIGPLVMLAFGLLYFFIPPKEANHSIGFRTYFGMGSVEAWRFTQKIAGLTWGILGLILSIIMFIISRGYAEKDVMAVAQSSITCLLWQAALAFFAYVGICGTVTLLFDWKGNRRFGKKAAAAAEPTEVYVEPTEEPSETDEYLYPQEYAYPEYDENAAYPDYAEDPTYGGYEAPADDSYR